MKKRGRPKKRQAGHRVTDERQRARNRCIRASDEEWDAIRAKASLVGRPVTRYLIDRGLQRLRLPKRWIEPSQVVAMVELSTEVRSVGVNVNQIVRALNAHRFPPESDIGEALAAAVEVLAQAEASTRQVLTLMLAPDPETGSEESGSKVGPLLDTIRGQLERQGRQLQSLASRFDDPNQQNPSFAEVRSTTARACETHRRAAESFEGTRKALGWESEAPAGSPTLFVIEGIEREVDPRSYGKEPHLPKKRTRSGKAGVLIPAYAGAVSKEYTNSCLVPIPPRKRGDSL